MTVTSRQHGTYAKYKVEKCSCADCRAANREGNRRRARTRAMAAQGMVEPPWLPAEPVRRHVRNRLAAGLGAAGIEGRSGVARGTIERLVYGRPSRHEPPSRKIRPAVAARLMALPVPEPTDTAVVDATAAHRRLQALVAVGWSGAELMRRIGVISTDFPKILGRNRALTRTDRAIEALYDQLWDVPPPTSTPGERATRTRAVAYATAHGWAPPMAWDDDTIGDPAARPDGIRKGRAA